MANSITLSTALVSDIQSKIDAGTATAEQVVLYTKGLNQLQTGNDFQSVVIGLAQSAVDAIDSSNAQFQEDSQNALNIFSNTAGRIDSSSADAVTSINNAKDTLNQTSTNIESTLTNLTTSLPTISVISREVDYLIKERATWQGVYQGQTDMVHPFDRPAYIIKNNVQADNSAQFFLCNHWDEIIDEIGLVDATYNPTATNTSYGLVGNSTYRYYRDYNEHDYSQQDDDPGTASSFQYWQYTNFMNNYHGSHHHAFFVEKLGIDPKNWGSLNRSPNDTDFGYHTGIIVGDPNHKEWYMYRNGSKQVKLGKAKFISITGDYRRDYYYGDSPTYNYGPVRQDTIDDYMHWRFDMPSAWHNSGYNAMCYNKTLNKLVIMRNEYDEADNGSGTYTYLQTPYVYSMGNDFSLEAVAKNTQQLATYDEDLVGTGKLVEDFHKSSHIDDNGAGGSRKRGYATINTGVSNEDRYKGHLILCDNEKLVHIRQITGNSLQLYRFARVSNDYVFEQQIALGHHGTNYGVNNNSRAGAHYRVSNDGKYVCVWSPYYHYGNGFTAYIVRVSDGAYQAYRDSNTSRGWSIICRRANSFLFSRTRDTNDYCYEYNCDLAFANHSDKTDLSGDYTNANANWTWTTSEEQFILMHAGSMYNDRSYYQLPGFYYNRDIQYVDNEGNWRSTEFDKFGNAI